MEETEMVVWTVNLPVQITAEKVGDAWMITDYRVPQSALNEALLGHPAGA